MKISTVLAALGILAAPVCGSLREGAAAATQAPSSLDALPDLPVRLRLPTPSLSHLDDAFRRLARQTGLNVAAQLYRKPPELPGIPGSAVPAPPDIADASLRGALNALCDWAGYSYRFRNGVLLLSDRTRFRDDDFQVPLSFERRLRAMDPSALDAQALIASTEISPKQRYRLSFDYPTITLALNQEFVLKSLRLYNALDASQQDRVARYGGIRFVDLHPTQRALAEELLVGGMNIPSSMRRRALLHWTRSDLGTFALTVTFSDPNDEPRDRQESAESSPSSAEWATGDASGARPGADPPVSVAQSAGVWTVRARAATLGELLSAISAAARVRFRADPSVRDRAVTVFLNRMPLSALKETLASIYGLKWQDKADASVLVLDARARSEEERQREAARQQEREERQALDDASAKTIDEILDNADSDDLSAKVPGLMSQPDIARQLARGLELQLVLKAMSENGLVHDIKSGKDVSIPVERIPAPVLRRLHDELIPSVSKQIPGIRSIESMSMARHGSHLDFVVIAKGINGPNYALGGSIGRSPDYPYQP